MGPRLDTSGGVSFGFALRPTARLADFQLPPCRRDDLLDERFFAMTNIRPQRYTSLQGGIKGVLNMFQPLVFRIMNNRDHIKPRSNIQALFKQVFVGCFYNALLLGAGDKILNIDTINAAGDAPLRDVLSFADKFNGFRSRVERLVL